MQRLLVLDLGDDTSLAVLLLQQKLQVLDVARLAGKAEGEKVHAELDAEIKVGVVLLRERRQPHGHARQVDVAAGLHLPLGEHGAENAAGADFGGFDLDHAAVHHDDVTRAEVFAEFGVVDRDRKRDGRSGFGLAAQLDLIARLKLPGLVEIAGADARSGEVHEHGDFLGTPGGGLAHTAIDGPHPVVGGVAHVQPENVGSLGDQLADSFGGFGGGSEGAEDFGFAHVRHGGDGAGGFKRHSRQEARDRPRHAVSKRKARTPFDARAS